MCVCSVFLCVSAGEAVKDETDKTVKVEPNKSASAGVRKTKAAVAGQKAFKVTPVKAVQSRSVRSKRRVTGEGNPAHGFWDQGELCLPRVWYLSACLRLLWLLYF